ncbi:MAG: response regulator, partial [Candidatus Scalindua sp.]|nr:response regulator [Candidatus Scalindua sp.]
MNNKIRVLVVDDEPKICHLIEELLKLEGYQVDVSFSGMDALQMLKRDDYQMMLTDLKMPGIDGLELIKKAKVESPEIRAIMVTGYATVDTAVQSLRHGVDDYITKPFNIFELKKAVKQTLHTRQVAMENAQLLKDLKKANRELNINKNGLTEKMQMTGDQLTMAQKELVQRVSELATVNEISKAITSVLDMGALLSLCLKEINEKLKVKHSSIMFVDEEGEGLVVKACHGDRS